MAKWLMWIKELISVNANVNAIILLVDFGHRIGEISLAEKSELLALVNVSTYDIVEILEQINVLYAASVFVDISFVKLVLREYVLANVITQQKADEIKTTCGL